MHSNSEETNDAKGEVCAKCGDSRYYKKAKLGPAEREGNMLEKRASVGDEEVGGEAGGRSKLRRTETQSEEMHEKTDDATKKLANLERSG